MTKVLAKLLLLSMLWPLQAWAQATYTLGIVPQFSTVDIGLRWTPLLERIRREADIHLQIRSSANIPAFEAEFIEGIPDFVFLNPYHMVMAAKAQGYRPLIRSSESLHGILVVKQGAGVNRIEDLRGATLAFPAPNAFGASLYMRALLSEEKNISFTPTYVGTHQNVYRHVFYGDALAGGGVAATLEREPAGIRTQLKVLYRTPDTASHPLAAHPRVPRKVADELVQTLRRIAEDAEGKKLLEKAELGNPVPADFANDYAPLEKLRLERYVVNPKK